MTCPTCDGEGFLHAGGDLADPWGDDCPDCSMACPECADAGLILDGGLAWPCLTCQREDAG